MPVVIVRPVGIFRAEFCGIENCKNPDYFNVLLKHEYDQPGNFKPDKYLQSSEDAAIYKGLQVGTDYYFKSAVGINKSSERDGRQYPARVNLKILDVKPATGQR